MSKITFTAQAYLSPHQTLDGALAGNDRPIISGGEGRSTHFEEMGYAHIGQATVTVDAISQDEALRNQIASLNTALQKERAESQARQNAILDRISKLQALDFRPG
ncbi:MAG: hypothetical protein WC322_00390 [Candidatus Paceibacterota bacterium]|jgi:hypothetical protein